ncbi:S9 family peptidase [Pyrinomonas methylaliphatogenes]|uniref:Dipeptidyl aminopeptidase/acylaminoacyl peptidase n=1 Tax=Pyrinomonas methylaliphatogenes TaxID=454194 RepID=A0A0B6WUU6_9BACT|nr:S9 family peptidase [Pyrinomonas methylaliphatogenes]CDM64507.1 dipeptidyl aminopeptidase/acylaminoacyl peptidase [Pyrinomonas methylaliphatogenes]
MERKGLLVSLALIILCAASGFAQKDRLTLDLFLDWEYVASPQLSPDGRQIVYTRRWTDKVNDKYEDEIWIMNVDGSRNRFLVKGSQAQWSPDGTRIAFIAPGQPSGAQIFVRWLDTGDTTQITHLERSPSNIRWSPDGKKIAFNMIVPATNSFTVKPPPKPNGAKWIDPPRVIDRLNYRADGAGYRPEGFMHIFIVSADGGTPRQVTDGDYNHGAPEWMPDSDTLVFSAVRKPDAEYLRNGTEIYKLSLRTGRIQQLTDRDGPDVNPTVSPDGRLIAYTGYDQTDDTYIVSKLYLMDADGNNKKVLTPDFDRSPEELFWAPDGSGIYFTTEDRGTNNLWFISATGGAPRQITQGNHQLSVTAIGKDGTVVGILTGPQQPPDVVVFSLKQPTPRRVTFVNDDLLAGRKLGEVEEIWYDSVGGFKIQGWIVKPPDFDPHKKYPLILYIHGGPHAMYGVGFNFEFQNHAAEGYVVLYVNPRGSTGYGQTFGNAIKNNYPGDDYVDLMRGVDEAIKRGYIDERNLFVCGGSGGGVLTAWIVGHTDRFAAAVSMKPVVNWYSFVGTTDSAMWYYNFKKFPWEDPQEHLRRSPLAYVGNVKTPTMLLTGELDLRTPMEQTEQFYRALKMRKVDTVMVRLNDEYHGFNAPLGPRHPSNRLWQILYLRGWFERYRKK